MSESVAAGGAGMAKFLGAASEAGVIIHGPPDVPKDAEIMGFCAVSENFARTGKYDWIVNDFLRWKLAFSNMSKTQYWYSATDMLAFEKNSGVDPALKTAGDKLLREVSYLLPSNIQFMKNLMTQVAAHAQVANARKTALLVMVFAPVSADRDICIDLEIRPGMERVFVSTEMIRETVRNAVGHENLPVTLMTVSPFTSGWLCRPSLFPASGCTSEKDIIDLVAKSCGGVFADALMNAFIKKSTTPLLTDEQRAGIPYEDIMPVGPTEEQTGLLHVFQRDIHEYLEKRLCANAKKTNIDFRPATDAWPFSRTGIPLSVWQESVDGANLRQNQDDENPAGFGFLGYAFGGAKESQIFHLKYLAGIDLDTCAGDWVGTATGTTLGLFRAFMGYLNPTLHDFKRVFDALEFRGSSMALAVMLAKAFKLPAPGPCRFWEGTIDDDSLYARVCAAKTVVRDVFGDPAVFPGERRHDFNHVRFHRASHWLSTCIGFAFADRPLDDVKSFVDKDIGPFVNKLRDTQGDLLIKNPAIAAAGKAWFAALEKHGMNLHERMKRKLEEMDANDRTIEEFRQGIQEAANSAKRTKSDSGSPETKDAADTTEGAIKADVICKSEEAVKPDAIVNPDTVVKPEAAVQADVATTSGKDPEAMLITNWAEFDKKYSDHSANLTPGPTMRMAPIMEKWKNIDEKPLNCVADYIEEQEVALKAALNAEPNEETKATEAKSEGKIPGATHGADVSENAVNSKKVENTDPKPHGEGVKFNPTATGTAATTESIQTGVEEVTYSIRHLSITPSTPRSGTVNNTQISLSGDPAAVEAFERLAGLVAKHPDRLAGLLKNMELDDETDGTKDNGATAEVVANPANGSSETIGESKEATTVTMAHLTPPQTPIGPLYSARQRPGPAGSGRDEDPDTRVSDGGQVDTAVDGSDVSQPKDGVVGAKKSTATTEVAKGGTTSNGVVGGEPGGKPGGEAGVPRLAEAEDFWAR
ncbi:hypothetical protein OQA88_12051, partial [Cercophora sp. LCS_1]